jgi:hypothetical protein
MDKHQSSLKFLCAIAIALGATGMAASAMGVASLMFIDQFQGAMLKMQPPAGSPQGDAVRKMNEDVQAAAGSMSGINIALAAINFVVSCLLLIGGILALRFRPAGRSLLMAACIAAVFFDLGALAANMVTTHRTTQAQAAGMQQMMNSTPGGQKAPLPPGFANSMMKMGFLVGMVFGVGWFLVKIAAYVATIIVLRKPTVRSLFAEEPIFATDSGENTTDDLADLDDLDH